MPPTLSSEKQPLSPSASSVFSSSPFTSTDLHLFSQGTHDQVYKKLGAHRMQWGDKNGYHFAVWAPNAQSVSVVGSFNGWDDAAHPMRHVGSSGIWETFIPNLMLGETYKYALIDCNGWRRLKADPYARFGEHEPEHASILCAPLSDYVWHDDDWMTKRAQRNVYEQPLSIYEIHADSWKRNADNKPLTYRELAKDLVSYLKQTGFTHVEFMPITEHPLTASWGYQCTGFFAPTSRYGTPQDFQYLVDTLHQNNIGVILDWVPGHFPKDDWGLGRFDGTALYEHLDPRQGEHPDWGTYIFNFGRNEVRNFLINSALFFADQFHIDGLRVDGVASMLYLDYSRKDGEWIPNRYGGNINLEAVDFLRNLNDRLHQRFPGVITIAEESTSFPKVSHPTADGGLGFDFKWNMGWMHDTLDYFQRDPIERKWHQDEIHHIMCWQYSEHFVNALSHDEVVYGKGSLLDKMNGLYDTDKFATLRAAYVFMFGWPGKKTLFMGDEFAQWNQWDFRQSLDWHLLQYERHAGVQRLIANLNRLYSLYPLWHRSDMEPGGFLWINYNDSDNSVFSFIRKDHRQRTESDKLSEALQPPQPFQPDERLRDVCRALGENTDGIGTDALASENSNATVAMNDIRTSSDTAGEQHTISEPTASSGADRTSKSDDFSNEPINNTENSIHAENTRGMTCETSASDCGDAGLLHTTNDVPNTCATDINSNALSDMSPETEPFGEPLLFISNFTPVERSHYKCGVPLGGTWREILNSDAGIYGGQNRGNLGDVKALSEPHDNQPYTLDLCLPPLSTLILEHVGTVQSKTILL